MNSDKIVNISPTYRVWCCLWVGQQFIGTTVLSLVVISGTSAQAFGEVNGTGYCYSSKCKSDECVDRCKRLMGPEENVRTRVVDNICYCHFY